MSYENFTNAKSTRHLPTGTFSVIFHVWKLSQIYRRKYLLKDWNHKACLGSSAQGCSHLPSKWYHRDVTPYTHSIIPEETITRRLLVVVFYGGTAPSNHIDVLYPSIQVSVE